MAQGYKRIWISTFIALGIVLSPTLSQAQNWGKLMQGLSKVGQAAMLTDAQVAQYVSEYIAYSDKENKVLPADNPYSTRLAKITQGIESVEGIPLNFAVYQTDQVNAFACADGSVRVYTGLMDLMTDDEVMGVIGHEIGHVAHHDSRNAFKQALYNSAILDAIGSTSSTLGALSESQLAAIGNSLVSAKFSRSQEQNADDYGYDFLVANGRNPAVMAQGFSKMMQLDNQGGTISNAVNQLFSSHPDTKKRIERITKRAKKEGYLK